MNTADNATVSQAKLIIAGEHIETKDILSLVKDLQKQRKFGLARRVLEKTEKQYDTPKAGETTQRKLCQQRALCTYKDPDLNPLDRLDKALKVLKELDNLDIQSKSCTQDQETLGLTGAIYKRMWELTNQRADLNTSLAYYARGYAQGIAEEAGGPEKDKGYTGINAAFVLDLIASLEAGKTEAEAYAKQALKIRRDIATTLPGIAEQSGKGWLKKEWWFLVTLAEAYFGLGQYQDAKTWLQQAAALKDVPEWEWETTTRQLARLLQLHEKNGAPAEAKAVLADFLGERAAGLGSLLRGKTGLALSGGGFRASLFHIGMLAKLAELDLLRGVEYLSCVSGGSIIGAHYYLEVRNLLQEKADKEITKEDYIELVKRVERDFLAGVQTNVRVQVLSEWTASAKMIYANDYSRTNRLGELYESQIYSRIQGVKDQVYLNDLIVHPKGETDKFSPKDSNWRRAAKIPILVLNATPLNTGHNWQFTATWMGEPPAGIGTEIDTNYRLRRMYYDEAPPPYNKMRLGNAVAASSCVPGLFEPLPLEGLYPDITVRLVDGGVHDNQGTAALLEQGCTVLLVSDASGQMDEQDEPSKGSLAVPLRTSSILQARIRESQYHDLDARRRSGLLQGLMFIHMKKGLENRPVDWKNCLDPSDPSPCDPLLDYGVQRDVQAKLAAVRTDLDSFSDAEAYSLMASAYLMTGNALASTDSALGFALPKAATAKWKFLEIEPELKKMGEDTPLMRQLKVSDKLFLRIWMLSKPLKIIGIATVIGLLALLAYASYLWWAAPLTTTWGKIVSAIFVAALGAVIWKPVVQLVKFHKTPEEVLLGLGMIVLGSFFAKLHLKFFDKWFLKQGNLEELKK